MKIVEEYCTPPESKSIRSYSVEKAGQHSVQHLDYFLYHDIVLTVCGLPEELGCEQARFERLSVHVEGVPVVIAVRVQESCDSGTPWNSGLQLCEVRRRYC